MIIKAGQVIRVNQLTGPLILTGVAESECDLISQECQVLPGEGLRQL